ncbi:MAG: hypothetical protein JW894_10650 [Bacteroidales bacterium]|nr:hypothetical protein [Bacteroidales bacterium]
MYRLFALIINLIASLTLGPAFQNDVEISISAPTEVVAGTEFEVTVRIIKSDLESFSRLQQTFPAGLKARSFTSANADFTSESKRVRMIWLRLPRENEFSVVYKIKADERLKGVFSIDGKFSYIDQNERKSVTTKSTPINILPSPNIDPALIVDIDDYDQMVIPYIAPAVADGTMACIRQTPVNDAGSNEYIVNVLVNKATQQKFAKIEEKIPAGYKAVCINPKDAIFTFKNNTAKFLWMNLPSEPNFLVSYKLIPVNQKVKSPDVKGKFSYLEGESTISIDIKETSKDLTSLSQPEINELIASMASLPLTENIEKPISTEVPETPTTVTKKPGSQTSSSREFKSNLPYMLEPEQGVYYRVQLAAGHKSVEITKYFKKYNLDKEVRKEYHEGWHKYSVGSFSIYKEARDYRVHIWNTTIIDDAFVAAYNNGNRITVQEALMIANQKWYK